jgi:hypothetical protein
MQKIDAPIIDIILWDSGYRGYLKMGSDVGGRGVLWNIIDLIADNKASWIFTQIETVRYVFNGLLLQKPHYCWKKHEKDGSEPGDCPFKDNPVCWHPEETRFYHGLWVAAYLCRIIQPDFPHVLTILDSQTGLDYFAQEQYEEATDTQLGKTIAEKIKEKERELWEETIQPYMLRVSEILRTAA